MIHIRSLVLALASLVAFGMTESAYAEPVTFGQWYEFSFTAVGVQARGCSPVDPTGLVCTPSAAGNSVFVGAAPWTFTFAPMEGVLLTVTDAFLYGDSFNVFNFGVLIGGTPLVAFTGSSCGSNPDVCLADPRSSHASFFLPAGMYSITIAPTAVVVPGAAYFRLDPVPEPATIMLLGTGLLGLAAGIRRRHKSHRS